MNNLIRDAKEEMVTLEEMMIKINAFLENAPEGCLKWQNRRNKTYYYQQYRQVEYVENVDDTREREEREDIDKKSISGKWNRRYITNENMSLAKSLAKKYYYITLKKVIQKRLKVLRRLIQDYPAQEIEAIYDEMSNERKLLIEPIEMTVKEKVKQWENEIYEKNTMYSDNLRYETEQGELVRSKSEVIIANILFQHREDILYKYERPLQIIVNGKEKTIYPDFTILNLHTGKMIYWEHAGLLDDPFYAGEFVRKINGYIANDLLPGRDMLLTFETQSNALDIGMVKKMVSEMVEIEAVEG